MADEKLDMHSLAAIIVRRRNIVLGILGLAMLAALAYCVIQPTQYEGTVSVRIQYQRAASESNSLLASQDLIQQQILTYAEIARSRAVVQPLIDTLYTNPADKPSYTDMVKKIDARPVRGTEMLVLSILAESPPAAQKAADLLLANFTAKLTDIVRSEGKESKGFIADRMEAARKDLDQAERQLVDFKAANQAVSIGEQARSFVDRQTNLKRLEAENQLALDKAAAQMRSPAIIPDTPVVAQYKSRLGDQEAELAGLLKNHTESHPKVIALRAAMEENRNRLNEELARIARGEYTLGQTQRASLQRLNSQEEKEMAALPAKEQALARLTLNYSVAQDLYVMLVKRHEEARINEVMQPTNVQIVDVGSVPEKPARPRWLLSIAVALVLGMFCGLSAAFLTDYFYKTIDTAEDVKRHLGLRVIGSIPSYSTQKDSAKVWSKITPQVPRVVKSAEAKSQEG